MQVALAPSFDAYWKAARERLDNEFERALPNFFDRLPPSYVVALRDVLAGGKRLRGCFVCLLNDALGGTHSAAIPRALAVECVHAASLIHDDMVDGDTSRRSRPATWTTLGPRRAVLLGDLMFATALHRMTELSRDDGLALAETIAVMATGAYQEPLVQTDLPRAYAHEASFYPELIYLKTGILFGTAARMGALAAGASPALAAIAFTYGARTGEAYQIADDLQDLVECAADEPPSPQQLALLAPALWHFCGNADLPRDFLSITPQDAARLRPQLRSAMLAAIEARLQQAITTSQQLPRGPHDVLLSSAPRHVVQTMTAAAP